MSAFFLPGRCENCHDWKNKWSYGFNEEKSCWKVALKADDLKFINSHPLVQSLLYDLNLLPEQEPTGKHFFYMASVIDHMKQALLSPDTVTIKRGDLESAAKALKDCMDNYVAVTNNCTDIDSTACDAYRSWNKALSIIEATIGKR